MRNSVINFPVTTLSLGRNGSMKTVGLDITSTNNQLSLTPINSKNNLGRCEINIPKDPAVLRQLIERLQSEEAALTLQASEVKVPFHTLTIGDSFNWRTADKTPREFVKINGTHAAPKVDPNDHWSFRGECDVQPWPAHLTTQSEQSFSL